MSFDPHVELENAKNSNFLKVTDKNYKCLHCNYTGKLIHNPTISDTLHLGLIAVLPLIIFTDYFGIIDKHFYEQITNFWYISVPIIIYLGYKIATSLVPYYAKCPSCGMKTKGMIYSTKITTDKNFEALEEDSNSIEQVEKE